MFQAMYTVWGIDRMTVGRAFAWREAPSLDHDDLTFVEEAGVYPQWLPQGLPFVDPGTPELPPPRPPTPPRPPSPPRPPLPPRRAATPPVDLSFLDGLDDAPAPRPSKRRPADDSYARQRAKRGTGRIIIQREPILQWARESLDRGVMGGGSCAAVCVQDQPGVQPRWRYTVTPGIIIGIVDTIVGEAVARMNEARARAFTVDDVLLASAPRSPPPIVYPASALPLPPASPQPSEASASDEEEEGLCFANFDRAQAAEDDALIWAELQSPCDCL